MQIGGRQSLQNLKVCVWLSLRTHLVLHSEGIPGQVNLFYWTKRNERLSNMFFTQLKVDTSNIDPAKAKYVIININFSHLWMGYLTTWAYFAMFNTLVHLRNVIKRCLMSLGSANCGPVVNRCKVLDIFWCHFMKGIKSVDHGRMTKVDLFILITAKFHWQIRGKIWWVWMCECMTVTGRDHFLCLKLMSCSENMLQN